VMPKLYLTWSRSPPSELAEAYIGDEPVVAFMNNVQKLPPPSSIISHLAYAQPPDMLSTSWSAYNYRRLLQLYLGYPALYIMCINIRSRLRYPTAQRILYYSFFILVRGSSCSNKIPLEVASGSYSNHYARTMLLTVNGSEGDGLMNRTRHIRSGVTRALANPLPINLCEIQPRSPNPIAGRCLD